MVDGQGRRAARPSAGWRMIVGLLGIVALGAAAPDQSNGDLVAKGKYLADLGDCASCHTAVNGAKFAGGATCRLRSVRSPPPTSRPTR